MKNKPPWIVEKYVSKGEYIYAVVPDHPKATDRGYVLAHRVLVENTLGRLLAENEIVHHKNGDKRDNRPENLEPLDGAEHSRLHAKQRHPNGRKVTTLFCRFCGVEFERFSNQTPEAKGQKNSFCSRRCNGKFYAGVSPLPSKQMKG